MAKEQQPVGNGAELFIRALENEGVKYIFAVPGEENLAFLDALRNSSIELVLNRHEQAAGFMARPDASLKRWSRLTPARC